MCTNPLLTIKTNGKVLDLKKTKNLDETCFKTINYFMPIYYVRFYSKFVYS